MKTVFMFPGQGSQEVGMGHELAESIPEIAELYRRANEIVGYDLAALCFDGPQEKLNTTEFSQPGIFVTSVACLEAMRMGGRAEDLREIKPEACIGLSLGEYTALYAAGAMEFAEALRLVQLRGKAMHAAAEKRKGAMVSIIGLDEAGVEKLCQAVLSEKVKEDDGGETLLSAVNFNCPGQIVVSGSIRACDRAAELAQQYGAGRAVPLRVAGAFHTDMMAPAVETLRDALRECDFSAPKTPVIANVDAQIYGAAEDIPEKLLRQLVSAVRWQPTIERLLDEGMQRFVEIGPGRVLTGLVKKTCRPRKAKPVIIQVC